MYEKTTVPNPPVGASGEQPQFKETTGSIANTTGEIKLFDATKQKFTTVDGPSGPSLDFLTGDSKLPPYVQYPRFLLERPLSETQRLLYALLLDRARLSMRKADWTDKTGRVFIHFPITDMAEKLHKGTTTIKTALSDLEHVGLIVRRSQGVGKPSLIYVRIPTDGKLTPSGSENCPGRGQISDRTVDGKLSGSKNNIVRTISKNDRSENSRSAFGPYQNVFLTKDEYGALQGQIRNVAHYIDRLSSYMANTGRHYSDHAATMLRWAEQDGALLPKRDYDCQEGESL